MLGNQPSSQETDSMDTSISVHQEVGDDSIDGSPSRPAKEFKCPLKRTKKTSSEEIMLVDEVDVFFGSEFYGRKSIFLFSMINNCTRSRYVNSHYN